MDLMQRDQNYQQQLGDECGAGFGDLAGGMGLLRVSCGCGSGT